MKKTIVNSVAAVAASLALSAFAADMRIDLKGDIDAEQAVAAPVSPILYRGASRKPDGLAAELRVVDGSGKAVPFAIRPSMVRTVSEKLEWVRLSIVSAVDTNGTLAVEAEWPAGTPQPERFASLKVDTPLSDFDERITVSADDVTLAEGEIYDRRKFADVRKEDVKIDASFRRRIKVVFSKPTAEVAARSFERTVTEGSESGTATRRVFSERAFRVDSLSVSVPKEVVSYEPAKPYEGSFAATPEFDAKAKKTYLDFDAAYMPVCALSLDVKDRNFSRNVRILARANGGWRQIVSGRIVSIDLPGEKKSNLAIHLHGEVREEVLRIEVDDMDNPRLEYGDMPVKFSVAAYDAVFIAKPGEKYALTVVKGAEKPRYDSQVLDYLLKSRNLKRLECEAIDDFQSGSSGPTAMWISTCNPVAIASTAAFIILAVLAFVLFKSNGNAKGG